MRRVTPFWMLLCLAFMASAFFVQSRLSFLPSLPVSLSPSLRVRSVKAQLPSPTTSAHTFQRDDQIFALNGRPVDDLRDLLLTLKSLTRGQEASTLLQERAAGERGEGRVDLSYQVTRPLHRFNLLLQGEPLTPGQLPQGVESGDLLVELDGRPMRPKVTTEGLRSIVSSRPNALLVLERKDAVFTDQVGLEKGKGPQGALVLFGAFLLGVLGLWRFSSDTISPWAVWAVGVQTLALTWCTLLAFEYQWMMADYGLAMVVVMALLMARPLGIFARSMSAASRGGGRWVVLGLGALGALVVGAGLFSGRLRDAESAFQLAAALAGLFVIFEIVLTSFKEGSGVLLGERSIYLAGLLTMVLLGAAVMVSLEPVAFRESAWRWILIIVFVLVWSGDVILCLRGVSRSPLYDLISSERRLAQVEAFLLDMERGFPGHDMSLVVFRHSGSHVVLSRGAGGKVASSRQEPALLDALWILAQEQGSIPHLPDHPQASIFHGFAASLGLSVAHVLYPPERGVQFEGVHLAVVGRVAGVGAAEVFVEDLEAIQRHVHSVLWSATVLEALGQMERDPAPLVAAVAVAPEVGGGEDREEMGRLRRDHMDLLERAQGLEEAGQVWAEQLQAIRILLNETASLPQDFESLLEPELASSMRALMASEGPVWIRGVYGVGKNFVGRCGHLFDPVRAPLLCLTYDASLYDDATHDANLLGQPEAPQVCFLAALSGGTLVVDRASRLGVPTTLALLERAEQLGVRVVVCDDMTQAGAAWAQAMEEVMEGRQVHVPEFAARTAIQQRVVEFWLQEAAWVHQAPPKALSPSARKALARYAWPGQVEQVVYTMMVSVGQGEKKHVELGDLPMGIRT